MHGYPRFITSGFELFDPVKLAGKTESIVCRSDERKYTAFYATGVYSGIATGYTVGCCLRCYYCWVSLSRDFPEEYGGFFSPKRVVENLERDARKYRTPRCRISGGEPTLCESHLLGVLRLVENSERLGLFILETNGILFGADENYVKKLAPFKKVHVRVSLKAGNANGFKERTGAVGSFYELPFKAVENLIDAGVSFHVAAMTDPRIMPKEERKALTKKLASIDERAARNLEEEVVDPYDAALFRLRSAGVALS